MKIRPTLRPKARLTERWVTAPLAIYVLQPATDAQHKGLNAEIFIFRNPMVNQSSFFPDHDITGHTEMGGQRRPIYSLAQRWADRSLFAISDPIDHDKSMDAVGVVLG